MGLPVYDLWRLVACTQGRTHLGGGGSNKRFQSPAVYTPTRSANIRTGSGRNTWVDRERKRGTCDGAAVESRIEACSSFFIEPLLLSHVACRKKKKKKKNASGRYRQERACANSKRLGDPSREREKKKKLCLGRVDECRIACFKAMRGFKWAIFERSQSVERNSQTSIALLNN